MSGDEVVSTDVPPRYLLLLNRQKKIWEKKTKWKVKGERKRKKRKRKGKKKKQKEMIQEKEMN